MPEVESLLVVLDIARHTEPRQSGQRAEQTRFTDAIRTH